MSDTRTAVLAGSNPWQQERTIRTVLDYARTVAIVGLSPQVIRASYFVGYYLSYRGYRVVPVNPSVQELFGQRAYPSLSEIPFPVDVVDVFRRPEACPDLAREAIRIGARAFWMQFGVISPEAAEIAQAGGLDVVMDRCMKVEHARYRGQMHWFGLNTGVVTARRQRIAWR
jgi:predicted CoA-binding protein